MQRLVLMMILFFPAYLLAAEKNQKVELSPQTIEQIADKAADKAADKIVQLLKKQQVIDVPETPAKPKQSPAMPKTNDNDSKHTLRMATGTVGGNYYVLGQLVGGAISHPNGSLPCGQGGSCGLSNVLSVNLTSSGSQANLNLIKNGDAITGFSQSDLAYWSYTGTGAFANKPTFNELRAIASLYSEAVHIVVRKSSNIKSINDLRGKRVSIGSRQSGTIMQARLVLNAYKMSEDEMQTEFLNNQQAIKKLKDNQLDALFFTVGVPAPSIEALLADNDYELLSLDAEAQQAILHQGHYFMPYTIKAGAYKNNREIKTISVYVLWLTRADVDDNLIYEMTKALWSDASRYLLNSSYIGQQIDVDRSLDGIGIPLHNGAKRFYNEIGKRF